MLHSAKPKLIPGLHVGILSEAQSTPLSRNSLQVNTTKMTWSITVHEVCKFRTKFVSERMGKFPFLRNFSSYSDNFPKPTSACLSLACPRGEHQSRQHTRLLAARKCGSWECNGEHGLLTPNCPHGTDTQLHQWRAQESFSLWALCSHWALNKSAPATHECKSNDCFPTAVTWV